MPTSPLLLQNSLPPLKATQQYADKVSLVQEGAYGVPDNFRNGLQTAKGTVGAANPVEIVQLTVCLSHICIAMHFDVAIRSWLCSLALLNICKSRSRSPHSSQHNKNQDDIRLSMLGAVQGGHMPMRIQMERVLVSKVHCGTCNECH
jgi:hypothetical protein